MGNASGNLNATNITNVTPITNLTNGSGPNITNASTLNLTNGGAQNITNTTNASVLNVTNTTNVSALNVTNTTNVSANASSNSSARNCTANLTIYYFYSNYCPYCAATKPFIDEVGRNYTGRLCITRFETSMNRDNLKLFYDLATKTKFPEALQGVPTVFINGTYITGAADVRRELVPAIEACLSRNCTGPAG